MNSKYTLSNDGNTGCPNGYQFQTQMKHRVEKIEGILTEYLPRQEGFQSVIMEAMSYSLMAGGKRLRPMLMNETYRLFGGEGPLIRPFMAAIEMIHTYSLVHDDLPAMDNDEYRRGRKTTHIVYGEDMGILAGDALLNYAFETAFKAFVMEPEESLLIGRALGVLGEKAGIYGMIGGQVIDVKETGHSIPKEVLDTIYELKTSALIEASMMIGAILGGASEEEVKIVEKIARYVGIAFQIQDDILDVTSTKEVLGKPTHSDEKNEKTTYVTLMGTAEAGRMVEELSDQAVSLLHQLSGENEFLEQLLLQLIPFVGGSGRIQIMDQKKRFSGTEFSVHQHGGYARAGGSQYIRRRIISDHIADLRHPGQPSCIVKDLSAGLVIPHPG